MQPEGVEQAHAGKRAGIDQTDRQDQQQRRAQRPGVAPRQVGARRRRSQPAERRRAGARDGQPQPPRERIAALARQLVVEGAQGLMRRAAVRLDPGQPASRPGQRSAGGNGTSVTATAATKEPGRCRAATRAASATGQAARSPGTGRSPPGSAKPGQAASNATTRARRRRAAGSLRARIALCHGHPPLATSTAPVLPCGEPAMWYYLVGKLRFGSRRGLITAQRPPSTSTSAALGREL